MQPRARGFNLLECLVALALGAICLACALPAWHATVQAQRVRAASAALHDALRLARLDARRHAREVRVCPSGDGRACQTQARWEQGWVAVVEADSRQEVPVLVQARLPGVRIDASAPFLQGVRFDAGGWPRQSGGGLLMGRWRVCPLARVPSIAEGRELVMAASGRLREEPVRCRDVG